MNKHDLQFTDDSLACIWIIKSWTNVYTPKEAEITMIFFLFSLLKKKKKISSKNQTPEIAVESFNKPTFLKQKWIKVP